MQKQNDNPWFSMWLNPRRTIRYITETNPKMGFYFLASIWFLQLFFLSFSYASISLPIHPAFSIIIAIIISPIIGGLCFHFFGWLLYITGKWLKGSSDQINLRCSFAWSRIPVIVDLIMWAVLSITLLEFLFASKGLGPSFSFINLIAALTSIWSFVLLVLAVQEVQKFSLSKALINVILAYIFIFAV